jgi:YopT peptidase
VYIVNPLTNALLGQYVKFVRGSVGDHGGHLTWSFSQAINPVASMIGTNTETADGICEMLSAKWIDEHAHDRSLATWLADGDRINPSKVRMLMQLFIVGTTMRPSKMLGRDDVRGIQRGDQDQDKATQNFLLSRGIIRRGGGLRNGWGVGARGR